MNLTPGERSEQQPICIQSSSLIRATHSSHFLQCALCPRRSTTYKSLCSTHGENNPEKKKKQKISCSVDVGRHLRRFNLRRHDKIYWFDSSYKKNVMDKNTKHKKVYIEVSEKVKSASFQVNLWKPFVSDVENQKIK